jgi:anti-sigma factor RsiW
VTCREATEFLTDYIEGDLPPDVRAAFEDHLSRCANCVAFLAQFRRTIQAEGDAYRTPDADAAAVLPEELVQSILRALAEAKP